MIFADPTELREGTRLPQQIVSQAVSLNKLEEKTGADLLISPLRMPATTDHLLRQHTEGGILVQRKTGNDFISSITDCRLFASLQKMLEWSKMPWLVVVGNIERRSDGASIMDGRASINYNAAIGALDKYQLRGGYVTVLDNDDALVSWIGNRLDFLRSAERKEKQVVQHLISGDSLLNCLCTLPGLGEHRAKIVFDKVSEYKNDLYPPRRFLDALDLLTNPFRELPNGIGEKTRSAIRDFVGLEENDKSWDVLSVVYAPKE